MDVRRLTPADAKATFVRIMLPIHPPIPLPRADTSARQENNPFTPLAPW